MKQSEIKQLITSEIEEHIENQEETLSKLKMTHSISPIENPMLIRNHRRTIARLKTELGFRLKEKNN